MACGSKTPSTNSFKLPQLVLLLQELRQSAEIVLDFSPGADRMCWHKNRLADCLTYFAQGRKIESNVC